MKGWAVLVDMTVRSPLERERGAGHGTGRPQERAARG